MTKEAQASNERSLWLKWLAANALGLVAGQIGGISTGYAIGGLVAQAAGEAVGTIVALLIVGGLTGGFLGVTQRIFLQREIDLGRNWVWSNVAGWAAGYVVATSIASALSTSFSLGLSTGVFWALIGLAIGIGQWQALRDRIPRAVLWIPANVAGWLAGPFTAGALLAVLFAQGLTAESAMAARLASDALTGAVAGMVTGFALIRLLRESAQPA